MNRKFNLIGFTSPENLTLTEAKRILGNSINKLIPGTSIKFNGYGNGINFTIERLR